MGKLKHFPIPAEAVRKVLEVQRLIRSLEQGVESLPTEIAEVVEVMSVLARPVTVRQAFWIARLRVVAEQPVRLWTVSLLYSLYEELCYLAETDFDTHEVDELLLDDDLVPIIKWLALKSAGIIVHFDNSFRGDLEEILGSSEEVE